MIFPIFNFLSDFCNKKIQVEIGPFNEIMHWYAFYSKFAGFTDFEKFKFCRRKTINFSYGLRNVTISISFHGKLLIGGKKLTVKNWTFKLTSDIETHIGHHLAKNFLENFDFNVSWVIFFHDTNMGVIVALKHKKWSKVNAGPRIDCLIKQSQAVRI